MTTDPNERAHLSADIFFWPFAKAAAWVARPATPAQVADCLRLAQAAELPVALRGGGMSYTGGYVPSKPQTLLLDLRDLNRVREIDTHNRYVTVEAGATWETLMDALAGTGLRPRFQAPFSGSVSTIGGAFSQGTVDAMDGVLGMEIVTGSGELMRTGSASRTDHVAPFFRNFGPDLTGLFIADGGTLGVKTAVTLQLEERQPAAAYLSVACESFADLVRAASACGQSGLPLRITGLDPTKSQNAPKVGFRDAIRTLAAVANADERPGMKDALKLAASGGNFMEGVTWSLHVIAEGVDTASAEAKIGVCRERALAHGREIANLLPMALHAKHFSVRGFLGPAGERWVPTNSLFQHGDGVVACERIQAFFEDNRARMNDLGIRESYIMNASPNVVLIEPSFYWPDEVSTLHLAHLDGASRRRFKKLAADRKARAAVQELRHGLVEVMDACGAVHVQLGKHYRFADRVQPANFELLRSLAETLDPAGILNPGNLGLRT